MASSHKATFTWGEGPQSVYLAGNWNNWSDEASPLHKQADGTFSAEVPLPWGEKQAFKYVVDGEWKVREDEAKEWDAAGNMNNVYTAPHAPVSGGNHASVQTAGINDSSANSQQSTAAHLSSAPSAAVQDTAAPISQPTEASSLLASSAPSAASNGSYAMNKGAPPLLGGFNLGAVTDSPARTSARSERFTFSEVPAQREAVTAAVPYQATPVVNEPTSVKIEKMAANANIGEATDGEQKTMVETASTWGLGAISAFGAVVGGAVVAVERATGIQIPGTEQAISVDEAKAEGIDVDSLPKVDATSHAAGSSVGNETGVTAADDLEAKIQELKVTDTRQHDEAISHDHLSSDQQQNGIPASSDLVSNTYNANDAQQTESNYSTDTQQNDIPAQHETRDANHQTVPQPIIADVSERDPRKDRSLAASGDPTSDTTGTKPIDDDPGADSVAAKHAAESHPTNTGFTPGASETVNASLAGDELARERGTAMPEAATGSALPSGTTTVAADSRANNFDAPEPKPVPAVDTAGYPSAAGVAAVGPSTATTTTAAAPPSTPLKISTVSPSAASTPASTPAKSVHTRAATDGDVRKRKSSFFAKIKHVFKEKDKK